MAYWWQTDPNECFWCEVTDRDDIGADLKCPTRARLGEYWSYSLITAIWPGDIVFHYSTGVSAFVGASVAGGPLEERPIVWAPHTQYRVGSIRDREKKNNEPRPGWWLPLYRYTSAQTPLSIEQLAEPENRDWIVSWIDAMKEKHGFVAAPVTRYGKTLRGGQGYLFKMPAEWVTRWPELSLLATNLSKTQDELAVLSTHLGAPRALQSPPALAPGEFRLKSAEDYEVVVRGGTHRRTRQHERLIRVAGESMRAAGAHVTMPHPVDLAVHSPVQVIVEAKTLGGRAPLFAIREAVGQLLEYRHFKGPRDAALGILLEADPGAELITYVEKTLGMYLLWCEGMNLRGGPLTAERLVALGVLGS